MVSVFGRAAMAVVTRGKPTLDQKPCGSAVIVAVGERAAASPNTISSEMQPMIAGDDR